MELNTKQAYQFLREQRPVLLEQGLRVQVPEWWDQPDGATGGAAQAHERCARGGARGDGSGAGRGRGEPAGAWRLW
jgi:hypothetical protein